MQSIDIEELDNNCIITDSTVDMEVSYFANPEVLLFPDIIPNVNYVNPEVLSFPDIMLNVNHANKIDKNNKFNDFTETDSTDTDFTETDIEFETDTPTIIQKNEKKNEDNETYKMKLLAQIIECNMSILECNKMLMTKILNSK